MNMVWYTRHSHACGNLVSSQQGDCIYQRFRIIVFTDITKSSKLLFWIQIPACAGMTTSPKVIIYCLAYPYLQLRGNDE
jgi:hypothetical protein